MHRKILLRRREWLLSASAAFAAMPIWPSLVSAQDGNQSRTSTNVVWIYKDMGADRSPSEIHFTPFYYSPEAKATDITTNAEFPTKRLDPDGEGTCLSYVFTLNGANDYASAGFMPGSQLGDRPPYDVAKPLAAGFGRPVYLKFRARTANGRRVRVSFTSGGFAKGDLEDGVKPAQSPKEDERTHNKVTTLTDKWETFVIDLRKKAAGLDSVVNPLQVIARYNDNRVDEVTVYVDDVRYEVGQAP